MKWGKSGLLGRLKGWHMFAMFIVILSLVILIAAVITLLVLSSVIESSVRHGAALKEDGPLLTKWSHPQYAIQSSMWVFSVRNPDDILHNNSVPHLKKEGPYVFDQKLRRKIHSLANGTVRYETLHYYYFNEEHSCQGCFLYNRLWVPNLIYQKFVEAASKPAMRAASAALVVQTPFLEVEIAELLFEGYVDPFLDQVCAIPFVNFVCESILSLPERIGFFYKKNGSSTGVFEVMDGLADDGNSLGRIESWNGKKRTPEGWWSTPQAEMINGSDGTLFKPFIAKKDNLTVFVPDLCRSIQLVFEREVDYEGVHAYRFVVPKSDFDFTLPENKGFCNEKSGKRFFTEQEGNCLPNGLLDISRCQKGEPPVVISMPNFLFAPDYVQRSVEGLREPDEQLDHIEVDIEPRIGAILQAKRRFQINVAMWRGNKLAMPGLNLSKFRSSIVPVISVEEHSTIDADSLHTIKERLVNLERKVQYASALGILLAALVVISILIFIYLRRRRKFGPTLSSRNIISPKPSLNLPTPGTNGATYRGSDRHSVF